MAITGYYHVTSSGAGDNSGDSWGNAMAESDFETHLEGSLAAGEVFFVKEGTYTLDSAYNFSANDGTAVSPISIIGVKSGTTNEGANVVYTDWARAAANRPFFDTGTYKIQTGDYTHIRNISVQGDVSNVLHFGTYGLLENCKVEHDAATGQAEYCIYAPYAMRIINCEITAPNAYGIASEGGMILINSYIHDVQGSTGYGVRLVGAGCCVAFNILDACKLGVDLGANNANPIFNNTFYDNDVDCNGTNGKGNVFINNLHESTNTDAYKYSTQTDNNFFWNNWGDDTRCNDMWDGVASGTIYQDYVNISGTISGDPSFTTAGSDFSLTSASDALNAGFSIELGV